MKALKKLFGALGVLLDAVDALLDAILWRKTSQRGFGGNGSPEAKRGAFARRLHDTLQGRGIRCWLDEHQQSLYAQEIDHANNPFLLVAEPRLATASDGGAATI